MPNHITNILSFENIPYEKTKEILEVIKNDEFGIGSIDFNRIIPMPEHIFKGNLGREEREKYGCDNWYDWSIKNWGTKWNAYEFIPHDSNEESNQIKFCTAWDTVPPIIRVLSEMYPDVIVKIQWANEDFGYNVGVCEYINGSIIYETSLTAVLKKPTKWLPRFKVVTLRSLDTDSLSMEAPINM